MASSEAAPVAATTEVRDEPASLNTPPPPATPAASDEAAATEIKLKVVSEEVITSVNGPKPEKEEVAPAPSEKENENAQTAKENGELAIEKENGGVIPAVIEPPKEDSVNEILAESVEIEVEKMVLDVSAEVDKKTDEEAPLQPVTEIEDVAKIDSEAEQVKDDTFTLPAQPEIEPPPPEATAVPEKKKEKSRISSKSNSHPSYTQMITEAIISLQDRTGSSQQAIAKSIEAKHDSALPPNFRKSLTIQLKRLCENGQLVKVKNSYKLSGKTKNRMKKQAGGKSNVKPKLEKPEGKASKRKTKPTKKTSNAKKRTTATNAPKTDRATKASGSLTKSSRARNTKAAKTDMAETASAKKPAKSSASAKVSGRAAASSSSKKSSRSRKAKPVKPSATAALATKRKTPASSKRPLETEAPPKRTRRSSN